MVYYSEQAEDDLYNILVGLANREKHPLKIEHALSYYDDVRTVCDDLDKTTHHLLTRYVIHKAFGTYVYKYIRNKNTTWYIIYDYDKQNNIVFIQHITSNHMTKTKDFE